MRNNINVPVIANKEAYIANKVSEGIPRSVATVLAEVTECRRDIELKKSLMSTAYNVSDKNMLFSVILEANQSNDIHGLCSDFELSRGPILKQMSSVNQAQLLDPDEYDRTLDIILNEQIKPYGLRVDADGLTLSMLDTPLGLSEYSEDIVVEPNTRLHIKEFTVEDIQDYLDDPLSVEDFELLDLLADGYGDHFEFMFKRLALQLNGLVPVAPWKNIIDSLLTLLQNTEEMKFRFYARYDAFLATYANWKIVTG